MSEDELMWDMSDDELAGAFKEAKAQERSPETDIENNAEQEQDNDEADVDETDADEDNNDDSEQPDDDDVDQDSDHNDSDDSDEEDAEDEDLDDEEETNPDEDVESEDDKDSEAESDKDEKPRPVENVKFKANGKEYEFSNEEIAEQFPRIFGQAMDYTKKMQAIKPWRKTIDALENAELGHDDINLMIDVLKGDKEAMGEVFKRTGTDALDLDLESSNYVAKDYGRDDSTLAIKDVVDDISRDVEYATTNNILSKQWDDKSWNEMAATPEMIRLLHSDVKDGTYDTIQPLAEKLKVYDSGKQSDLDYYKKAAQQYYGEQARRETQQVEQTRLETERAKVDAEKQRLADVKAKSVSRTTTKNASAKRKAAAPTRTNAGNRATTTTDYLNASDEEFEEWRKQIEDQQLSFSGS